MIWIHLDLPGASGLGNLTTLYVRLLDAVLGCIYIYMRLCVCYVCVCVCVLCLCAAGGGVPQQLWMNRNTETGEASAHGTESSYSKE